jgi:hypothetical protein
MAWTQTRANGKPTTERLSHTQEIRHDTFVFVGEKPAGAPKSGEHLVVDKECPSRPRTFCHPRKKTLRG